MLSSCRKNSASLLSDLNFFLESCLLISFGKLGISFSNILLYNFNVFFPICVFRALDLNLPLADGAEILCNDCITFSYLTFQILENIL